MKLQLNVGGCDFSKFNHEMDAQRGECRAAQDVLQQHPPATKDVQELWVDKERGKGTEEHLCHMLC